MTGQDRDVNLPGTAAASPLDVFAFYEKFAVDYHKHPFLKRFTVGAHLGCIVQFFVRTPNALADVLLLHCSTCACWLLFSPYAPT